MFAGEEAAHERFKVTVSEGHVRGAEGWDDLDAERLECPPSVHDHGRESLEAAAAERVALGFIAGKER